MCCCPCVYMVVHLRATVQASAAFKYLALRCRGEAPDAFQEHLSTALAAHKQLMEQQQRQQRQQQQQQQAQGGPQQPYSSQQQAAPWSANAGPVSHPIAGPLATGSFDGPLAPGLLWGDTSSSQQQQQYGGGLPPRSPAGGRVGLQAVDGELLTQLMDMVSEEVVVGWAALWCGGAVLVYSLLLLAVWDSDGS
jgi:hypothetical protein